MEKEPAYLEQYEKKKGEKEILEKKLHEVLKEVERIAHEKILFRIIDIVKNESILEKKIEKLEQELKKVVSSIDDLRDHLRDTHSSGFDDND